MTYVYVYGMCVCVYCNCDGATRAHGPRHAHAMQHTSLVPTMPHTAHRRGLAYLELHPLGSLLGQAVLRGAADRLPYLLGDGQRVCGSTLRRCPRRRLAGQADRRAGSLGRREDRRCLGLEAVDEEVRLDGNHRVSPALCKLLRLALADHRPTAEHTRQQLDAEREAGALVPAEGRDGAALERLGRVSREAAVAAVSDSFGQRLALGLGGEHAEERDRRGGHVECERRARRLRNAKGDGICAKNWLATGRGGDKLRRVGEGDADGALPRHPLAVEGELPARRGSVVRRDDGDRSVL
mmetsp:Transcript_3367/g.10912  ORF Transcript_3367/g.10912 Transcript_3367/m.10912 type:complete len:296 (+) Transcript_3367:70-957(+)